MGLKINGATSGSIEIDVPAVAGTDTAITIPAVTGGEFIVSDASGNIDLGALDISGSAAADSVVIDSSGRLGLGTSSPVRELQLGDNTSSAEVISLQTSTSGNGSIYFGDNQATSAEYAGMLRYSHSDDSMQFWTSSSEQMRLSSGVGFVTNLNSSTAWIAATSSGSSGSIVVFACRRSATAVNNGTNVFFVYANGSYGTVSDVNQKKNIETTRDGYLEDLNRLRVVKYNWNDQEDTEPRELGLIAQEVEEVFPGLVSETQTEGEDPVKGIKYSVLPVMLLKALQEADAKIEAQATQLASQAATIAALDARLTALEGGAA